MELTTSLIHCTKIGVEKKHGGGEAVELNTPTHLTKQSRRTHLAQSTILQQHQPVPKIVHSIFNRK